MELSTEGFGRKDIGSGGGEKLGRGERYSRGGTAGQRQSVGEGGAHMGGGGQKAINQKRGGESAVRALKAGEGRVQLSVHILPSL